jgi:hypothetical protein
MAATPAFGVQRPPMAATPAFGVQRPPMAATPVFGVQRPPMARTPAFGLQRPPMAATPAFGVQRPPMAGTQALGVQRPPMAGTPALGVQRPPMARSRGAQPGFGGQMAPPAPYPLQRTQRETARVQIRSRSHWRGVLVMLVLVAGGGAAAVHYFVMPLDVLLVWRNPARLSIATEPEGASVRLDGVALGSPSPTIVSVRRDLADHVIEATLPGYHPARAIARYERSVSLSALLRLKQDPVALVPAPSPPIGAPAGPASRPASPGPPPASPGPSPGK